MSHPGDYYLIEFSGVYLGGFAIVRADDASHAIEIAKREIPQKVPSAENFEVKEFIFPDFGQASVIWDGDY